MKKIYANNLTTLSLGRQGENLARQVVFDIRDLESLYGSGTVEVIHQRPGDAQPYPLAVQRDGTLVTWDVTATDTEMDGYGKCELRYYVGETLAKSQIWRTWVESAMDTPSETTPPEPEQGWVDQVLAAGAAAMTAADGAKADADRAAALAVEVTEKAAQTAQDASDAAKAMEAAQTAQRLAEEAQGAAEAARSAAAAAQAATEKAATDAEGAKQDAETALKSAQDAAAAAANTLESIQTLYQEMQTWAQGVIQDVNAAGSAAVQSVQSAGDTQVQRVTDEGATQTANAKAQADAAAQSASEAAQSAQQAAESAAVYDTVVADVTQLKEDITAITPDDTAVNGKPWTSKKIVDSLCQPIEETGNPVQCYPVEGYPLGVTVQIEPKQEGSGDPSPENVRPITGRDSVSVTRCGKNLLDFPSNVKVSTLANTSKHYSVELGGIKDVILQWKFTGTAGNTASCLSICYNDGSSEIVAYWGNPIGSKKITKAANRLILSDWTGLNGDMVIEYVQLELGDVATAYEPYHGDTTDIALPETVYGGTLDLQTGLLTVDKECKILQGTEQVTKTGDGGTKYFTINGVISIGQKTLTQVKGKCSHFPVKNFTGSDEIQGIGGWDKAIFFRWGSLFETIEDVKTYIAEQYAADTPVQIYYSLNEPYTIQLAPQQIAALSGVNTLYTDADGVIVTGAEDPKHTITELKNAIISLGGNV